MTVTMFDQYARQEVAGTSPGETIQSYSARVAQQIADIRRDSFEKTHLEKTH
jgi:hypothetical protein